MRHIGDDPTASTYATKEAVTVTLTVTNAANHEISSADMDNNDT